MEAVAEISSKPNTKVLKKYNSNVFRGVSVEATSESPESLQKSSKISNAWQSHLIKRLPTILADGVDPKNYSLHASKLLREPGIYNCDELIFRVKSDQSGQTPSPRHLWKGCQGCHVCN